MQGATVVEGRQAIEKLRLFTIRKAMELELLHGLKACRISPFRVAREQYGIEGRAKQKVYEGFCKYLQTQGFL